MSLSNPRKQSPVKRFFKIKSGSGEVVWWDKSISAERVVDLPFRFIVLDVLSTVGGFHEPGNSGIWANEVQRNSDILRVRTKAGPLIEGAYPDIKDKLRALGGKFANSVYIAYQENGDWVLGNINFVGSSVGAWFDFRSGRRLDSDPGVMVTGFEEQKKGRTEYFVPEFDEWKVPSADYNQALQLDGELQAYLSDRNTQDNEPAFSGAPAVHDDFNDEPPF